jgi:hypothetical protein
MTVTEPVPDIVVVKESGDSEPKKCSCCKSIYFKERSQSKDSFGARYVDCLACEEPHRIGGFAWPA